MTKMFHMTDFVSATTHCVLLSTSFVSMSKEVLPKMDHNKAEIEDIRYLVQRRRPGKRWVFRYVTLLELVGVSKV